MDWKILILTFLLPTFAICYDSWKSSLVFIIDNTASMSPVINQVKSNAKRILNTAMSTEASQIANFVLITFNDHDKDGWYSSYTRPNALKVIETTNSQAFKQAIDNIVVNGGGDCPEYSLTGIELALKESLPRSYLYVFTDATSKDHKKYEEVKNLALQKSSQIYVILSESYCLQIANANSLSYKVYEQLAQATSGQLFKPQGTDIEAILNVVNEAMKGRMGELARQDFTPGRNNKLFYTKEEFTDDVFVFLMGLLAEADVTDPDGYKPYSKLLINLFENKVMQVKSNKTGVFTVTVKNDYNTTVIVKGRTSIDFQYKFKNAKDVPSVEPLPDVKSDLHIYLNVLRGGEVKLTNVQLLDLNGTVLKDLYLTQDASNRRTYKTGLFEPPKQMFRIKISGYVVGSKSALNRLAPTAIQPKSVRPRIQLDKDKTKYTALEGDKVLEIPCRATGYPTPSITWKADHRPIHSGSKYSIKDGALMIHSPVASDTRVYTCVATNKLGEDRKTFSAVVELLPKIQLDKGKTEYTAVEGDEVLRIPCRATGHPTPSITWEVDRKPVVAGPKFSIRDGALIVQSPAVSDTRDYTCVATNKVGEDRKTFKGVVEREITFFEKIHKIYLKKGETHHLECRVPHSKTDTVRWFEHIEEVNRTESTTLDLLDRNISESGKYSCRVSNQNGYAMDTYDVNFGYAPTFEVYQDDELVDWTGAGTMDCTVSAEPTPTVEWYQEGTRMKTADDKIQLNIPGWGQYSCNVSNIHGSIQRRFVVTSTDCLIHKTEEERNQSPIILSEDRVLFKGLISYDFLTIPNEEKLILSCQSPVPNSFKNLPGTVEVAATCHGKDQFLIDGKPYKYSDLQCEHTVDNVIERTGEKCMGDNTELVKVGYQLREFIEVYRVCMDLTYKRPLYSRLTNFNSNDLSLAMPWQTVKDFDPPQSKSEVCKTPTSSCCFSKEQLVNAAEVPFGAAQRSTFINNLNTVPLWKDCNNSRYYLNKLESTLSLLDKTAVWSGASQYHNRGSGIVPKYLWKVVKASDEESMAFVYVNEVEPAESDVLCHNVCPPGERSESSWIEIDSNDKFMYCCELNDFMNAFHIPPNVFTI